VFIPFFSVAQSLVFICLLIALTYWLFPFWEPPFNVSYATRHIMPTEQIQLIQNICRVQEEREEDADKSRIAPTLLSIRQKMLLFPKGCISLYGAHHPCCVFLYANSDPTWIPYNIELEILLNEGCIRNALAILRRLARWLASRFIRRSFSRGGRPFFASPKKGEGLSKVTSSELSPGPGLKIKFKGLG
jgi:hypothetical protein